MYYGLLWCNCNIFSVNTGVFAFANVSATVSNTDKFIDITVVRNKGIDGVITVDYKTIDDTARKGHDYAYENDAYDTYEKSVQFDDTEVC